MDRVPLAVAEPDVELLQSVGGRAAVFGSLVERFFIEWSRG